MFGWLDGWVGGWSDTDDKANLSPASLCYAANETVTDLGNTVNWVPYKYSKYSYIFNFRN